MGLSHSWHARIRSDNKLEWILSCVNPSSRRIRVSRSVNCPSGPVYALQACIRSRSPKSKNSPSGPSLCFRPMSSPFLAHSIHCTTDYRIRLSPTLAGPHQPNPVNCYPRYHLQRPSTITISGFLSATIAISRQPQVIVSLHHPWSVSSSHRRPPPSLLT